MRREDNDNIVCEADNIVSVGPSSEEIKVMEGKI